MIILPAIDIKNGTCVRLTKGDFATVEKVAENPLETALSFQQAGAEWIHMVDLDGALEGSPANKEIFIDVAQNTGLKVEVGGGIRSLDHIEYYVKNGIERVILGSAAVNNPQLIKEAVKEYGDRIAVGIDARNEMVAASGWIEESKIHYLDLAREMEVVGVKYIIFTDISKDGTLSGPNLDQLAQIDKAVSCQIIASGGIHVLDDIKAVKEMGLYGVICGKSIYKGTLSLEEAIKVGWREKMGEKRIIPCLDVMSGKVVKGINFEGMAEVGDPVDCAMAYEKQGADEIAFLDITATNEGRGTMVELVKQISQKISVPLTVGGGVRNLEDFSALLKAGAHKVSINSAAIKNPDIIAQASAAFGKEAVVIAIDGKKMDHGGYGVYIHGGKTYGGLDAVEWAVKAEALGAGEILLTSMDGDGTNNGFDIELLQVVCEAVNIPVVASGGCGGLAHFTEVFQKTAVDAALAASVFHYGKLTIGQVKKELRENNIPVK